MWELKQRRKSKVRQKRIVAVHAFLVKNGKVLLLKRKNTGFGDGEYSVPAGHVEPGESVVEAITREVNEEVGVRLSSDLFEPGHVMDRIEEDERIDLFFVVERWKGVVTNAEPEKCAEVLWVRPNRLPDNTIPYIRQALAFWQQGKFFSIFR